MQEQKTLNLLNFSTNEFNTHCQEILKEMVEKILKIVLWILKKN